MVKKNKEDKIKESERVKEVDENLLFGDIDKTSKQSDVPKPEKLRSVESKISEKVRHLDIEHHRNMMHVVENMKVHYESGKYNHDIDLSEFNVEENFCKIEELLSEKDPQKTRLYFQKARTWLSDGLIKHWEDVRKLSELNGEIENSKRLLKSYNKENLFLRTLNYFNIRSEGKKAAQLEKKYKYEKERIEKEKQAREKHENRFSALHWQERQQILNSKIITDIEKKYSPLIEIFKEKEIIGALNSDYFQRKIVARLVNENFIADRNNLPQDLKNGLEKLNQLMQINEDDEQYDALFSQLQSVNFKYGGLIFDAADYNPRHRVSDRYSQLGKALVNSLINQKIDRTISYLEDNLPEKNYVESMKLEGQAIKDDLEYVGRNTNQKKHTRDMLEGIDYWQTVSAFCKDTGLATDESIGFQEKKINDYISKKYKNDYSKDECIRYMGKYGNPELIPQMVESLKYEMHTIRSHNLGKTIVHILKGKNQDKVNTVVQSLNENIPGIAQLFEFWKDKNSYVYKLEPDGDASFNVWDPKKTVKQEINTRLLEEECGINDKRELRKFYNDDLDIDELFEKLHLIADKTNMNEKGQREFVSSYLQEFGKKIGFLRNDPRKLKENILRLSSTLQIKPAELWKQIEDDFMKVEAGSWSEYVDSLKIISELTGETTADLVDRHFKKIRYRLIGRSEANVEMMHALQENLKTKYKTEEVQYRLIDMIESNEYVFKSIVDVKNKDYTNLISQIARMDFAVNEKDIKKLEDILGNKQYQEDIKFRERLLDGMLKIRGRDRAGEIINLIIGLYDNKKDVPAIDEIFKNVVFMEKIDPGYKFIFDEEEISRLKDISGISQSVFNQVREYIKSEGKIKFINIADRNIWRKYFGQEQVDRLLNALPKETDEKRNAFTHNQYDRTSNFLSFMATYAKDKFVLDDNNLTIITEYIDRFKLSQTPKLYEYYYNVRMSEISGAELPPEQINDGILSTDDLEKRFTLLKDKIFGLEEINKDLKEFAGFEVEMLKYLTGHSTHRFRGRPMEIIIRDFEKAINDEKIAAKPESYKPEKISMKLVDVKNDIGFKNNTHYQELKSDAVNAIDIVENNQNLKTIVSDFITEEINNVKNSLGAGEANKFLTNKLKTLEKLKIDTKEQGTNQLFISFLKINKGLLPKSESIRRTILFTKIFERYEVSNRMQMYNNLLHDQIPAIYDLQRLYKSLIKEHLLDDKNEDQNWEQDEWRIIKKQRKNLLKLFKNHIKTLHEYEERIENSEEVVDDIDVDVIPDRGLVGELSGYLADVCYTKVYPLLEQYPNVVPYKFVTTNKENQEKEFVGSVLIFELEDENSEKVMLVRAFDVPQEDKYKISLFIESYIDKLGAIGRENGFTKIIMPGLAGALSNYSKTINYMNKQYKKEDRLINLKEKFDFNGYDLTNNSYLVREIT